MNVNVMVFVCMCAFSSSMYGSEYGECLNGKLEFEVMDIIQRQNQFVSEWNNSKY